VPEAERVKAKTTQPIVGVDSLHAGRITAARSLNDAEENGVWITHGAADSKLLRINT
jgi:hypothetical protein